MFVLPELPYAYDALEPVLSAATMVTHHDKHHAKYVEVTNTLLKARDHAALLEGVILAARRDQDRRLFNNAAQAWNHGFFWECMAPGSRPATGALAAAIIQRYGSLEGLKAEFLAAGIDHFGSGWAWIVAKGEVLSVTSTHDAATAITEDGATPLLVCDVWEHAYYLDHRNNRAAFLTLWWDRLANWAFAERQYAAARGIGEAWCYPAPKAD